MLSVTLLPPGSARALLLCLLRLRFSPAELSRAESWFRRWGRPTLVLAWLPVIGVPLCLVADPFRVGLLSFVLLVGAGKSAR